MREILFRGKRVEDGEWVEGNLIIDESGRNYIGTYIAECSDGKYQIAARGFGKTINRFVGIGFIMVDPETVGQYTGLKDKNGNMIFEGDIVDILTENEEIGVIGWYDGCFEVAADGFVVNFNANINGTDVEIIGNIYDNPELLNPEKYNPDEGGGYETL